MPDSRSTESSSTVCTSVAHNNRVPLSLKTSRHTCAPSRQFETRYFSRIENGSVCGCDVTTSPSGETTEMERICMSLSGSSANVVLPYDVRMSSTYVEIASVGLPSKTISPPLITMPRLQSCVTAPRL